MLVDHDLIPEINDGLNATIRQLLQQIQIDSLSNTTRPISGDALIRKVSHNNQRLMYDYEDILPVLAEACSLNIPVISAKSVMKAWGHRGPSFDCLIEMGVLGKLVVEHNRFPTLFVNGSMYMQCMASQIPPHNLSDICAAVLSLLDNPALTNAEIIEILRGPDFPSRGVVYRDNQLEKFYTTGQGCLTIHPRMEKTRYSGRNAILISELPYLTDAQDACETIKKHAKKTAPYIRDLYNLSERNTTALIVILKSDEFYDEALQWLDKKLKKKYPLRSTVLISGKVSVVSFKELLMHYLSQFQKNDLANVRKELEEYEKIFGWERRTTIL